MRMLADKCGSCGPYHGLLIIYRSPCPYPYRPYIIDNQTDNCHGPRYVYYRVPTAAVGRGRKTTVSDPDHGRPRSTEGHDPDRDSWQSIQRGSGKKVSLPNGGSKMHRIPWSDSDHHCAIWHRIYNSWTNWRNISAAQPSVVCLATAVSVARATWRWCQPDEDEQHQNSSLLHWRLTVLTDGRTV